MKMLFSSSNKNILSLSDASCHNCHQRTVGCHSRCYEYKKWLFTKKIFTVIQENKLKQYINSNTY